MEKIAAEEVGKRLPEILDRAALGEHFTITQNGEAKAEIGPPEETVFQRARAAADTIRDIQTRVKPLGMPIRDAIEEGRR